jgi:hypothetical protein
VWKCQGKSKSSPWDAARRVVGTAESDSDCDVEKGEGNSPREIPENGFRWENDCAEINFLIDRLPIKISS